MRNFDSRLAKAEHGSLRWLDDLALATQEAAYLRLSDDAQRELAALILARQDHPDIDPTPSQQAAVDTWTALMLSPEFSPQRDAYFSGMAMIGNGGQHE